MNEPTVTELKETTEQIKENLSGQLTQERIERAFTYHAPKGDQPERYVRLRAGGKALAQFIVAASPASREQELAIEHLEMAIMWANAAIARNE